MLSLRLFLYYFIFWRIAIFGGTTLSMALQRKARKDLKKFPVLTSLLKARESGSIILETLGILLRCKFGEDDLVDIVLDSSLPTGCFARTEFCIDWCAAFPSTADLEFSSLLPFGGSKIIWMADAVCSSLVCLVFGFLRKLCTGESNQLREWIFECFLVSGFFLSYCSWGDLFAWYDAALGADSEILGTRVMNLPRGSVFMEIYVRTNPFVMVLVVLVLLFCFCAHRFKKRPLDVIDRNVLLLWRRSLSAKNANPGQLLSKVTSAAFLEIGFSLASEGLNDHERAVLSKIWKNHPEIQGISNLGETAASESIGVKKAIFLKTVLFGHQGALHN